MVVVEQSNTRFFTDKDNDSLYKKFISTMDNAEFFDILVAYFRTDGFYKLYEELGKVDKIRILIGLNTDKKTLQHIKQGNQARLDFESHKNCREIYSNTIVKEFDNTEETYNIEIAAQKLIEYLKSKKIEIRVHLSRNLHAKIYITRFREADTEYGRVITGSSNFFENELIAEREFNVELKHTADVEFALERFEKLWKEGVEVSEEYSETIQNRTWLDDKIIPYQIYLKFLYEYFKEDINLDSKPDFSLPDDFMNLEYQKQAVLSAEKILEAYGGVFLSDVVGLGKTFITALLLKKLPQSRKLIICPPFLIDYWKETLNSFYIPGCDVESLGKLEKILEGGVTKYDYIVVDEAHRFRNESSLGYEMLHKICKNKKVVLVSATPLNNKIEDIKNQIKLFQPTRKSDIPGTQNLDRFFKNQQKEIDKFEKGSDEYLEAVKKTSQNVRNKILKHIMVRRTRTEIKKYFSKDFTKQGLSFPKIHEPKRIIYEFDLKTEKAFNQTIKLIKELSYARYTPLLFLKKNLSKFDEQAQRNLSGFMKSILVKRLESSFFAFKKSLERFIESYQKFIKMYDNGTVWISKKIDVFELLDANDEKTLFEMLDEDEAQKYEAKNFRDDYKDKLINDKDILKKIYSLWVNIDNDIKAEAFIEELKQNNILKNSKIIIFSESKETVEYLQNKIDENFNDKVLSYHGGGGKYQQKIQRIEQLKELIKENYQPQHHNSKNDVKILITTDILAEGINLHRANIIINYDLPWNPTRVLQRVGRVNRIGTEHKNIYVFNIFPTSQSDKQLGLEDNIKSKIQAFHDILGEDAKYLSEEEKPYSHKLFGEHLYKKWSKTSADEDNQEEQDSELYYLNIIREVRDKNPKIFEKIKKLPKQARAGQKIQENSLNNPIKKHSEAVLTFFRKGQKGQLKKFILADCKQTQELNFLKAARFFECEMKTSNCKIPKIYYQFLMKNKNYLEKITDNESTDPQTYRVSKNENYILKSLKAAIRSNDLNDEDKEYLKRVRKDFEIGAVTKNTSKRIKEAIEKDLQPLNVLRILMDNIKPEELYKDKQSYDKDAVREVICQDT